MRRMMFVFLTLGVLNSTKAAAQLNLRVTTDSAKRVIFTGVLPQNFYNNRPGFFCKKEMQLQKITSLPVFIRLGSKDYVDYLERKPNAFRKD